MNNVALVGRISEPKLNFTGNGTAVLTFGLVTNRKVNGEDKGSWHNIKVWGELAENLAEKIEKGSRVMVMGYIEQETYEKDGEKKSSVVVVANEAGVALRWVNDNA